MKTVPGPCCRVRSPGGVTLIEILIVIAIIAVILSLALPVYSRYTTRTKVAEALSVIAGAKTAVSAACIENPAIDPVTDAIGASIDVSSKYVRSVTASGPCSNPVLTVVTRDTGVSPAITLTLSGKLNDTRSGMDWLCTSNTLNSNVPAECRI